MVPCHSRLFFALWPDDTGRASIEPFALRFHKEFGGRRTAPESQHITLAFLGQTPDARIAVLDEMSRSINTPSFKLCLTRAGGWPGGIFWLAPSLVPDELTMLGNALREGLEAGEFSFDRKPFVPHVTLLRKARGPTAEIAIDSVEWAFNDFALVKSVGGPGGVRYKVICRFPLQ